MTKEELIRAVWPSTSGSEALPKGCIRELRRTLGDDRAAPRFIESMGRRGYRFIAPVAAAARPDPGLRTPGVLLVGREAELGQLQRWQEKALGGERQVVFVTGEPGIGKTTVVDAFLQQVAETGAPWIARGWCSEQYGAGEAYLPVLEALGRLCRETGGERVITLLGQHAPRWLVQMPALLGDTDLEALQRKVKGATRERMLREMAEAVEALTAEAPLVLVLEDLQWSDYSTLDLISSLAQRREPARLLLIGTYRPADVIVSGHPLKAVKHELQAHGQCEELPLGFLTVAEISRYLAARFPRHRLPAELAQTVHRRTDGNPLFMVNVVQYLVAQQLIAEVAGEWRLKARIEEVAVAVPESLRQLIAMQIDQLTKEERDVLDAASVAGGEFSAATVAAVLERKIERVEQQCEELARRGQFLGSIGMGGLPDGTVAGRYAFSHTLYQQVLYDRLAAARRMRLHRRIGEYQEVTYGERAGEIAAELAVHFERGQDYLRAVRYHRHAAENALRRSAHREATAYLTKGLELLDTLPDTPERAPQELVLQITLGPALMATEGYAAPEVGRAYTRARELCRQVGDTPQLFPMLRGLQRFCLARAQLQPAGELGEHCLRLAEGAADAELLLEANLALGERSFFLGELDTAQAHLARAIALHDRQQRPSPTLPIVQDPGVAGRFHAALVLWLLGHPDQALQASQEMRAIAQERSHPFTLAYAGSGAAILHHFRREEGLVQQQAEAALAQSKAPGFALFLAQATFLRGWALAVRGRGEEGTALMRRGLTTWLATGAEIMRPYYLALLAEAYGKLGQAKEGRTLLAEALAAAHQTGERWWEPELHRLRGELTLESNARKLGPGLRNEVEECFRQAMETAHHQGAKSLELRAVVSLSRLWQRRGEKKRARQMLADIYGSFSEGFETADLREARSLLEDIG